MFEMTWTYLKGLQVFRMGVRRNNANYFKAGQVVFASVFHRSSAYKYALVDLHDRYLQNSRLVLSVLLCKESLKPSHIGYCLLFNWLRRRGKKI